MDELYEMMIATKDYNVEVWRSVNQFSHAVTTLLFHVTENVVVQRHNKPLPKDACDYAEKGLTCAMPL